MRLVHSGFSIDFWFDQTLKLVFFPVNLKLFKMKTSCQKVVWPTLINLAEKISWTITMLSNVVHFHTCVPEVIQANFISLL